MDNLSPEQRSDHNGKLVPRWIKRWAKKEEAPVLPASPPPEATAYSAIDALHEALPSSTFHIAKTVDFVAGHYPHENREVITKFFTQMQEKTRREVVAFVDDKSNGDIVRRMCSAVLSSMAHRYRDRSSDFGIDYIPVHNLMLLGEDFVRAVPDHFLDAVRQSANYGTLRDLNTMFNTLMTEIKPQDLSKVPNFMEQPELVQRRARVALAIASVYYTGADNNSRHRESELLDCVDHYFDRRFEISDILDRHMDASVEDIEENLSIETVALRDGWL